MAAVVVTIAAIGVLAVGDALQPSPVAEPTTTATPTARPSATPAADWGPVELAPLEPGATLEPSGGDDAGIAPDATFTLASLTDEPAAALAERLEITPATAYTVAPSADGAVATIQPATALTAGDSYRFMLRTPGGALAASWAFRVRGPVRVVGTIPGDATVGVPLGTGVELTFDQEGVADMADHFSIMPAVKGTFERHGRTQVFVPSGLAPATTYTVTVRRGLVRTGTDLALPSDVVFRFETEGPTVEEPRLVFGRDAIETGPGEAPMIAVRAIRPWTEDGRPPAPTTAPVRVYRFPSVGSASRALAQFLDAPRWTEFSDPLMPTDDLAVVAAFTAQLEPLRDDSLLLRYPTVLPEGIYVVELQGERPAQAFLQVTPVSAWVSVLSDRSVIWVNDVATHRAIEGATVAVEPGRAFATSDGDGLAIGTTPAALLSPIDGDAFAGSPILRVTSPAGDVTLVPFNVNGDGESYRGEWWEKSGPADESYWAMLYTDRGLYRRTDRIEAWGFLRGRDDDAVPARAVVRLVASGAGRAADAVALASVEASPGPDGAFTASLPIAGLPIDSYEVQALVDGRVVVSRWVDVSVIRKPPYQLELTPDHLAVIGGATVSWTATATFFDGTPVPSLDLVISDDETGLERRVTTDAAGRASLSTTSPTTARSPWTTWWVQARPQGPEAADISAYRTVVVFPSADYLDVSGVLGDGRVRVTGDLTAIDFARVEQQLAVSDWDWEPSGPPAGGRTIQAAITELTPTRRQVGSEYDFIEKTVRPVYEYDYERVLVRTLTVESTANGRIAVSTAVPDDDHQYEVMLTARDDAGHVQERTIWVRPATSDVENAGVTFVTADDKPAGQEAYGIGDRLAWRMVDDGRALPSGGVDRYLYLVAQRGLRSAVVTGTPRFGRTFAAADAPGVFVIGVRFTGSTYAPKAAAWANFDESEREIRVQVTMDRARYRPGETATISVRTTRPDGRPVAATVVLQAVDEKLYAMSGAVVPQPLSDLYQRVDSGIVRLTATHQVPSMAGPEGEGGNATGGGPRSDFKDTLLFRELRTDGSGRAAATVRMSDDLTSWHVTASAVTSDLAAGIGELLVPVGLPFFVELTVTDTYQVTDRPVIGVRAFGDGLHAGDPVDFSVAAPSLGLAETRLRGTAFTPVGIELPALSLGTQTIIATATAPTRKDDAGQPLADSLSRTFEVVTSRLTATRTAYGQVDTGLPTVPVGAERSTWTFTDAGRGRLVPILASLFDPGGLRIDRLIAQSIAADTLISAFGRDPASLPPDDFDPWQYPIGLYSADHGAR
ncbi:MAG TPA: Ig-like domain-containing protein, partial [Candidatus Limnocylindrales bacterium]|nr:Ig-like domain-containing protein [Candidatus Limnocylindrales bacterium]